MLRCLEVGGFTQGHGAHNPAALARKLGKPLEPYLRLVAKTPASYVGSAYINTSTGDNHPQADGRNRQDPAEGWRPFEHQGGRVLGRRPRQMPQRGQGHACEPKLPLSRLEEQLAIITGPGRPPSGSGSPMTAGTTRWSRPAASSTCPWARQTIAVAYDEQVVRAEELRKTTLLCLPRDSELSGI